MLYDPLCDDMVISRYGMPEPAAPGHLPSLASGALWWGVGLLAYAALCLISVGLMLAFAADADAPDGRE